MNLTSKEIAGAKALPSFIKPMRDAIRSGQKTQTRRIVKPHPIRVAALECLPRHKGGEIFIGPDLLPTGTTRNLVIAYAESRGTLHCMGQENFAKEFCPYGQNGDIQYLKEPLRECDGRALYSDTGDEVFQRDTATPLMWRWKVNLLTAMYMPKEAARIFVRRTETRIERLKQISESDSIAEGTLDHHGAFHDSYQSEMGNVRRRNFAALWDSINLKRGYPFDKDWWVWVIGFELINQESTT